MISGVYRPDDGRENLAAPANDFRNHRGGYYDSKTPDKVRTSARGLSAPNSGPKWRGFRVCMETTPNG